VSGDVDAIRQATLSQRDAADPSASVWVAANAGSGKTRVLVDRVTRLLLAGTRPHAILCLTFTKAAAAEMRDRLGRRLAHWATVDDDGLDRGLVEIMPAEIVDDALRRRARRLFATTLDDAIGLRVQTIHSFCESLLRRFPIEAGLSPHFQVLDEDDAKTLLREARDRLMADIGDTPIVDALALVVARHDEVKLGDALDKLIADRRKHHRLMERHGGDGERAIAALARELGLDPPVAADWPESQIVGGVDAAAMSEVARLLSSAAATTSDKNRAAKILAWLAEPTNARDAEFWLGTALTQDWQAPKSAPPKIFKSRPDIAAHWTAEQARLEEWVARLRAARQWRSSAAMLRLMTRLLALYADAKRRRAWLDYDDLIQRAHALLTDERAAWIRFKLDGGIDHILVDEAQDNSPEQWAIVGQLAGEFFAGEGARGEVLRTVFAVGDLKQSIFSFHGAEPAQFGGFRGVLERKTREAGCDFRAVELAYSFRSAPVVLNLVDRIYADEHTRQGVAENPTRHRAIRYRAPGLVELWDVDQASETPVPQPFEAPLDQITSDSPILRLADRIARTIAGWIESGETLGATGKPIDAGDVLILVRRRRALFEAIVRALKTRRVPVAGADRLALAQHIAVQDLLAVGRFVMLPGDDLALATVLKTPLFGFTDDDLFALCYGRAPRSLWRCLRDRAGEKPAWREAVTRLRILLARADAMPPYEFYARLLAEEGGRRRMLARLGPDALDPLDEFLAQALAHEHHAAPSLQRFLAWFERGGVQIKRDMDKAAGEVRVMTVHAAKGLEAPVVFLPEATLLPIERAAPGHLWRGEDPVEALIWAPAAKQDTFISDEARRAARGRRLEEDRRLLYVAATRAADRLYVAGHLGQRGRLDPESWYAHVGRALDASPDVEKVTLPDGHGARRIVISGAIGHATRVTSTDLPELPSALRMAPQPERMPVSNLAPSRAVGSSDEARATSNEESAAIAAERGRAIHRLLELLQRVAPAKRREVGLRLAAGALVDEALRAIESWPDFFAADAEAEIAIAGTLDGHAYAGQIDLLVMRGDEIRVLDFKTNRLPPRPGEAPPSAYLRQLAIYAGLLEAIHPGRRVRAFIAWTAGPRIDEIAPADLAAARGLDAKLRN
jgi:ATP-dependent helicase/nuclease subunit A